MKAKITPRIQQKLKAIAMHQANIKRLVNDIEKTYPGLEEFWPRGESWGMIVDRQGDYLSAQESEHLLVSMLAEFELSKVEEV